MTQPIILLFWKLFSCELLSNLYLCIGWHSLVCNLLGTTSVVNCFQICIFVSDDTAESDFVLFRNGCELLSNLYLCIGWHSLRAPCSRSWCVVNCFQICIFVSDDTALVVAKAIVDVLWIAFKFVSLYRMTQPVLCQYLPPTCCELLSNLYLCIGWHSFEANTHLQSLVVNCFQICIFVSDDTALGLGELRHRQLWIAFKFVSLYRMTQPRRRWGRCPRGCELLSNLYLCIGWHSCGCGCRCMFFVVNCFQICIFVSDDTADADTILSPAVLWIAFKFVSLYRMTQLPIFAL